MDPTPGILLLYPTADELVQAKLGKEWFPEQNRIADLADKYHLFVFDLAKEPQWLTSLYRDGTHPTVAGNQILAVLLSKKVTAISKSNQAIPSE